MSAETAFPDQAERLDKSAVRHESSSPAHEPTQPALYRVGFDADAFRGPDLLGITPDVDAFASLIAAKETRPPLSIGIFGAWGSGKTFFMRQLKERIGKIARDARTSGRLQKDISFYKRIAQVEFNAWHYVEGNLWASLVEHIFSTLSLAGEEMLGGRPQKEVEQLRREMLEQLQGAQQILVQAKEQEAQAKHQLDTARQSLQAARSAYDQAAAQLQELSLRNVAITVLGDSEVRATINTAREALGLSKLTKSADDFEQGLAEARAVAAHGMSIFAPIARGGSRAMLQQLAWLLLFLIIGPLLGFIAFRLTQGIFGDWLSQVSALLTAIAGMIGAITAWLGKQTNWVADGLASVEQAQQRFAIARDRALAQQQRDRAAAERDVELLRSVLAGKQQAAAEAEQRVAQAQVNLEQVTAERILASFIQDRVAGDSYRKYLGVLASVRQDFERLSDLITTANLKLEKIAELTEENLQQKLRINRIVLYIDDLDRCPPKKVVEVLQAVNLLLAFDLFVVVVAVDTRWIGGSLKKMYGDLLQIAAPERNAENDAATPATALDYLEKIFQIPLWLEPMDEQDRTAMLNGLIRPATDSHAVADEAISLQTTALDVDPSEHESMRQLAPLLGRSPRALKRFVNVYRLVKVSLSEGQQPSFLAQQLYQRVLFLLALVTSMPAVATVLFRALDELARADRPHSPHAGAAEPTPPPLNTWTWLCERIDKDERVGQTHDWHTARSWLMPEIGEPPLKCEPYDLIAWARRIGRYSFLPDGALTAPLTSDEGVGISA